MLRSLLFCLGLSAACNVAADAPASGETLVVTSEAISIDPASGLRLYQNAPFTGEIHTFHANDQIATTDQFRDGRRHGFARNYFATGVLGYELPFVDGSREGVSQTWWLNGNVRSQTNFKSDKIDGDAWEWYQDGKEFKHYRYRDGEPVGLQQGWRPDGKLFSNFEVRNGRIYGLSNANLCMGLKS